MRFPKTIHVRVEEYSGGSADDYHLVIGALEDVEEDGTAFAVYQLVSVGHVEIEKRFVEKRRSR